MNQSTKQKGKGRGGAGRGQGRKKGKKEAKTLEKERVMEAVRQRIWRMSDKLLTAQSVVALGYHIVVVFEKGSDGKIHKRFVTDPEEMDKLLSTGEKDKDYFLIVGDVPDHKAAANLLDRGLGKPVESIEHSGRDGKPLIIRLDE